MKRTKTDPDPLTDQQLTVIDHLIAGATRTEAADRAGIHRATLWRWLTTDAHFVAVLNERRQDIHQTNIERLRNLAAEAIKVLENSLSSENESVRLRAAMTILKSVDLADVAGPTGETDPESVAKHWQAEELFNSFL